MNWNEALGYVFKPGCNLKIIEEEAPYGALEGLIKEKGTRNCSVAEAKPMRYGLKDCDLAAAFGPTPRQRCRG